MVPRMPLGRRGGGRGDKRAQQALASAVIGRITGAADGADAVRRALARTELERPVRKVAIVDVSDARLAGGIAAALRDERPVAAGPARVVGLDGVDAVVAVVPAALAPADAVGELDRVRDLLLGVLLVGAAPAPAAAREPVAPEGDDPLAALTALERAAGPVEAGLVPVPAPRPSPEPIRKPKPERAPAAAEAELRAAAESALEARLAELAQREAALRSSEASAERVEQLTSQLRDAVRRAERAEANVAELTARLTDASQESARVAALESQLESRLAELAQREAALERIRESLAQREPDAGHAVAEPLAEPVVAEQRSGLFGRRRRAAADAGTTRTENETLRARIAELEQGHAEPPQLLPQPEPELETRPEPDPPAPLAAVEPIAGRPTIFDLERLVDDARARGMSEAEEWEPYVPLLRQHAASDGSIPYEFDDLLRDVFGAAVSV